MKLHNPVGVGMCHNESFLPEEGGVWSFNHLHLAESFHGIDSLRRYVTHELYLAESTPTDQFDDIEVIGFHTKVDDFIR